MTDMDIEEELDMAKELRVQYGANISGLCGRAIREAYQQAQPAPDDHFFVGCQDSDEPTLAVRCADLVKELRTSAVRKYGTADVPSLRLPVLMAELARQVAELDRWVTRQVRSARSRQSADFSERF